MTKRLLIIEDHPLLRSELQRHFERSRWQVQMAGDLAGARDCLRGGALPPVVLSDMSLPDGNALDLMEEMQGLRGSSAWVFLTGYGSVTDSVRALRLGAYDFLEKPLDMAHLDRVVCAASRSTPMPQEPHPRHGDSQPLSSIAGIVGQSPPTQRLRRLLERLAQVPFSALIINGETGTGKGAVARSLHHAGPRSAAPLVEVNCAAIPGELLESELFGHEPGAFTGAKRRRQGLLEQADGGTLFLDEIGETALSMQAKLLKALDEQRFRRIGGEREISVDVRVIAATNCDLADRVSQGRFREDLYHRLGVFQLDLVPLRERIDDIDELVPLFIAQFNAKAGRKVRRVDEAVWAHLRSHHWPGNVRELRNLVERCVLLADDEHFSGQWMQLTPSASLPCKTAASCYPQGINPPQRKGHLWVPLNGDLGLDDINRHVIATVLAANDYNVTATARVLQTSRDTLRYRIHKYGIKLPREAGERPGSEAIRRDRE